MHNVFFNDDSYTVFGLLLLKSGLRTQNFILHMHTKLQQIWTSNKCLLHTSLTQSVKGQR